LPKPVSGHFPTVSGEKLSSSESCEAMGVRRTAPPLGLITIAAMLPPHWRLRLIDCNVEPLHDADIDAADLVMTGGMLPQQADTFELIRRCRELGRPVIVGGPDVSSSPHLYSAADFRFIGEAEGTIGGFVDDFERGVRSGEYTAPKFQADVSASPKPRYDLLDLKNYLYLSVQFSRGCPFTCEFCDIIELYGRAPQTKAIDQVLTELSALHAMGYRGHVDFVDDNFIGNKKNVKLLLPHLIQWQRDHDYPFEFSTEASLNLADDMALLQMMKEANFFTVFIGIESPDEDTLTATSKKQNTRRSIVESLRRIYGAGMYVTAGFILGFDTESDATGRQLIDFIGESGVPVCMVGLLYALPNTQLTRRLAAQGRLHPGYDVLPEGGDQCTVGLNYDPTRPLRDILLDYRAVLQAIYEPAAYIRRVEHLMEMLDRSERGTNLSEVDVRNRVDPADVMRRILREVPEAKASFWRCIRRCANDNPESLRMMIGLMVLYLHLRPFSRLVIQAIDRRIASLPEGDSMSPPMHRSFAPSLREEPMRFHRSAPVSSDRPT